MARGTRGEVAPVRRFRAVRVRRRVADLYELLARSARNVVTGTDLLTELTLPGADAQSVSERLVELEHDSDRVTHEIYSRLNARRAGRRRREDVYHLGSHLDDVMDHLEAAGTLVYLYGLTELPALPREAHELIDVLNQQAEATADAMPRLSRTHHLREYWIECNRLENEGDRAYRMLLV